MSARGSFSKLGLGACAMALVAAGVVGGGSARAATAYSLRTGAIYRVDPAKGEVSVAVSATFTNTTPDPAAGFSSFGSVPLTLQAGAAAVAARDASGPLRVTLARGPTRTVATIRLRALLRYRRSAAFTLSYRLADGANPQVRVRASSVTVPVWGFGTAASVSLRLPATYTPRVIGGPLTLSTSPDGPTLSSGPIRDPARWSAMVIAAGSIEYVAVGRQVALPGGTVDLRVRSFADDRAWGAGTLELIAQALPALQAAIGLPYAGVGPLVVTESVPSGIGPLAEPATGTQEIAVALDAAPFTILHQVAHVWFGPQFASERWIREGFASHLAGLVARRLSLPVPARAALSQLEASPEAFPLAGWSPSGSDSAADSIRTGSWAYDASWAFVDALAERVGEDGLRTVVQRAARGVAAYDSTSTDATTSALAAGQPLDSRQLLDHLEEGASAPVLDDAFRTRIFPASSGALLDLRARARSAYAGLRSAAGDWGPPKPVQQAMQEWRFDDAIASVTAAQSWLADRDRFLAAARQAGLSTPDRLVARWRTNGGDVGARRELDAELAFLQAYRAADDQIDGLNPIERLGVLGGQEPRAVLAEAAGLFAGGDLGAAAASIERAINLDAGAQGAGVVRLAAATAVVAVLAAGVLLGLRWLRRWMPSFARL